MSLPELQPAEKESLCYYAKKFPKPKKTGCIHQDCQADAERHIAMLVVDTLVKQPSMATCFHTWWQAKQRQDLKLSLIHISEPTRLDVI
eukprot:12079778-Prorocentrum_lima.AAC.1